MKLFLVYSVYVIVNTHHITRNQIKTVSNMNMGKYSCQSSSTLLSVPKILHVPLEGEHSIAANYVLSTYKRKVTSLNYHKNVIYLAEFSNLLWDELKYVEIRNFLILISSTGPINTYFFFNCFIF